ncbi:MAG: hypothetical protein AAGA84_00160 [Pseudomonadota bacterium]
MKKHLILTSTLLVTLVACGKKETPPAATSLEPTAAATAILDYVPSDTPYVFAALRPTPEALTEKMRPVNEAAIGMMASAFRLGFESAAEDAETDLDPEVAETFTKAMDAMESRLSDGKLDEFGFDEKTGVGAFYGNGLLPVMRLSLAEPEKFLPELDEMLAEMELGDIQTVEIAGAMLRKASIGEVMSIFIGEHDDAVVLTAAPFAFTDDQLEQLLSKPNGGGILTGTVLTDLMDKYDYMAQGAGFIDFRKVFDTVSGNASGLDAALLEMVQDEDMQMDDTCRSEFGSIVANFPRFVIGSTRMDTEQMDTLPVLEMNPAIAEGLMSIVGNVPGMTAPTDAGAKFGFAVNIGGIRDFIAEQAGKISDNPYQCEQLASLNEGAENALASLNQPLPPIVNNFQGLFVEMDSLEALDFQGGSSMPEDLNMSVVLAMKNVKGAMEFGSMMMPMLAALNIDSDGEPVLLPPELTAGVGQDVFAAMTEDMLAMSIGDGADKKAGKLAAATGSSDGMLMAASMDYREYVKVMRALEEQMNDVLSATDDAENQDLQMDMGEMMKVMDAVADAIERETGGIRITPNGIELPTQVTLR